MWTMSITQEQEDKDDINRLAITILCVSWFVLNFRTEEENHWKFYRISFSIEVINIYLVNLKPRDEGILHFKYYFGTIK